MKKQVIRRRSEAGEGVLSILPCLTIKPFASPRPYQHGRATSIAAKRLVGQAGGGRSHEAEKLYKK